MATVITILSYFQFCLSIFSFQYLINKLKLVFKTFSGKSSIKSLMFIISTILFGKLGKKKKKRLSNH